MSFSQQHYQFVLRMSYPFLFTHHKVFLEIYHLLPCLLSALPCVVIKNYVLYLKDLYRLCSSCVVGAWAPEQNAKSRVKCLGKWRARQTILRQSKKSHRLKQKSLSSTQYTNQKDVPPNPISLGIQGLTGIGKVLLFSWDSETKIFSRVRRNEEESSFRSCAQIICCPALPQY